MGLKNFFRWIFRRKAKEESMVLALPAPSAPPTYKVIEPAAPTVQAIQEGMSAALQLLKIANPASIHAVSVPDSKAEAVTQAHLDRIKDVVGDSITVEESVLIIDLISTCHTGNPIFSSAGMLLQYSRTSNGNPLRVKIDSHIAVEGTEPSTQFTAHLEILKTALSTDASWVQSKTKETLESFLPEQGIFDALKIAHSYRTNARSKLHALVAAGSELGSFLENQEQLLIEYLFPSGINYKSTAETDKALIQIALSSYYKAPTSAGFSGLNGALLSLETAYAIAYNRALFGQASTYHVGQHDGFIRSSLFAKALELPLSEQSTNRIPASLTSQVMEALKIELHDEDATQLAGQKVELDFIKQWAETGSTKGSMPKQAETLKERFSQGYLEFSPLTKVEDKRSDLHKTWVAERAS